MFHGVSRAFDRRATDLVYLMIEIQRHPMPP